MRGTGASVVAVRGDINITPLIDVLLVLLVIFMVSVKVRQVLEAQIARDVLAGTQTVTHPIVLELRNDGTDALNQQLVTRRDLPGLLWHVFAQRGQSILFVKAGSNRRYGELVDALDVAKGAGVQVIAFAP